MAVLLEILTIHFAKLIKINLNNLGKFIMKRDLNLTNKRSYIEPVKRLLSKVILG